MRGLWIVRTNKKILTQESHSGLETTQQCRSMREHDDLYLFLYKIMHVKIKQYLPKGGDGGYYKLVLTISHIVPLTTHYTCYF